MPGADKGIYRVLGLAGVVPVYDGGVGSRPLFDAPEEDRVRPHPDHSCP